MREIKAIIRPDRLSDVVYALRQIPHMPGVTVSVVQGFGRGGSDGKIFVIPVDLVTRISTGEEGEEAI